MSKHQMSVKDIPKAYLVGDWWESPNSPYMAIKSFEAEDGFVVIRAWVQYADEDTLDIIPILIESFPFQ